MHAYMVLCSSVKRLMELDLWWSNTPTEVLDDDDTDHEIINLNEYTNNDSEAVAVRSCT